MGDPKPENETVGKLRAAAGCDPLDESRRRIDAEKRTHRRADRVRVAASRRRQEGKRDLPRNGSFAAGVLQLEAALRRARSERAARVAATPRREPKAENAGRGPHAGQTHFARGALKKGLKPAARRKLVHDVRQ